MKNNPNKKMTQTGFSEISQKREEELAEMDRIAKMLVRRDFELSEIREKREAELKELEKRTRELEESRAALMNMLEDVEEARGKAEKERDKTKAIITNFADGLIIFDKRKRIVLINPEGEKLLGVRAEEVEGRFLDSFSGQEALEKLAKLIFSQEKELFRKELFLKKPKERILEITTVSLPFEEEMVVILHDISREKMIERMKTEFVSLAAHQLRTPLSIIKWGLKLLLDGDLGKLTPEQRDFVEKTYNSNERMITLINDLLDVTRIEEGRYVYKMGWYDLSLLCRQVIGFHQEEIKKKKIKFEFKKPRKLPKVKVDPEKITLAIGNLLDNALRYTPSGGRVTISLKSDKRKVEFKIQDNGIGIPENQQERVFDKFFRASNAVKMETEGSGLGLFIVKNIIEAHGGEIWFASKEGKGSTFCFTLPFREDIIK
jgi:PAS domain S-box-containing protein